MSFMQCTCVQYPSTKILAWSDQVLHHADVRGTSLPTQHIEVGSPFSIPILYEWFGTEVTLLVQSLRSAENALVRYWRSGLVSACKQRSRLEGSDRQFYFAFFRLFHVLNIRGIEIMGSPQRIILFRNNQMWYNPALSQVLQEMQCTYNSAKRGYHENHSLGSSEITLRC